MREVAKSMLGFSWAVSLFGVQQLAKLVTASSQAQEVTTSQFNEATRAVQAFLNDSVAQQFRAGDEWQRKVVDTLFDAASLRAVDPRKLTETLDPRPFIEGVDPRRMLETGVDALQKSWDAVRQAVTPSASSTATSATPTAQVS